MIHIENLQKQYGGTTVLNIEKLDIPKGESFGLVGNNGAGKTTLFRLLLDLLRADNGFASINALDVSKTDAWKKFTGAYLDPGFLIDFLSPEEYFDFTAQLKGIAKDELQNFLHSMEDFFNHEVLGKKKLIRNLSMGNQQKVGIAAALLGKPSLVVLDEPFNSLDPSTQIRLKQLIKKLKAETGCTFLISSHDLNHVTEVCDRIVVLEEGSSVYDIPTTSDTLASLEAYFAV